MRKLLSILQLLVVPSALLLVAYCYSLISDTIRDAVTGNNNTINNLKNLHRVDPLSTDIIYKMSKFKNKGEKIKLNTE